MHLIRKQKLFFTNKASTPVASGWRTHRIKGNHESGAAWLPTLCRTHGAFGVWQRLRKETTIKNK